MNKILLVLALFISSCMVPYSSYDYVEPTRYVYYPTYQPTKVIVVKQKPHKHYRKHKRHIKVKINKHRKTK